MSSSSRGLSNERPRATSMLRATFFCALALLLTATSTFAQSARRPLSNRLAQSPSERADYIDAAPDTDIDLFTGRIIRKDGDYVIVYIMSSAEIPARKRMFYACDVRMRPTAILSNANVAHRNCATFKVESGTALVGDTVMVKYFAPSPEEQARIREERRLERVRP